MSFIDTDYEIPATGGANGKYLNPSKIPADQPYKIRVLTDSIKGWEYWTTDNKPSRLPFDKNVPGYGKPERPPANIRRKDDGEPESIKHFWAMVVWDYQDEQVKVFSCTQATIQSKVLELVRDDDWGHPKGYDLKIKKTGKGLETSYEVFPGKSGDAPAAALDALAASPIILAELLVGGDPFNSTGAVEQPTERIAELKAIATAASSEAAGRLKAAAKAAGYDTAAKIKDHLATAGGTFPGFNNLSEAEAIEFAVYFEGMATATAVDAVSYENIPF